MINVVTSHNIFLSNLRNITVIILLDRFWSVPYLSCKLNVNLILKFGWLAEVDLFVLRFYGPVNPMGHVERGQFTQLHFSGQA